MSRGRQGELTLAGLGIGSIMLIAVMCSLFPSVVRAQCTNESLRSGRSALLPDCRAYEMVTPPDLDGGEIWSIETIAYRDAMFPTELLGPSGDSVLYMLQGSPLKVPEHPSGTFDLYEARRSTTGWNTVRRLNPSGDQAVFPEAGGVSPDHLYHFTEVSNLGIHEGGSLAVGAYVSKPDGSFEYIGIGSQGVEPRALGRFISVAGDHIIFATGESIAGWCSGVPPCEAKQLEPDAAPTGTAAIYDRSVAGPTHVISLLPNNQTPAAGEDATYQGASPDGSMVAFTIGGTLYVRVNNAETKEVASGSTYAGISEDGDRLFFVEGGNIKRFDITSGATTAINTSADAAIVNISADGSRVYFVSPSLLDGSKGTIGEPNLYVWTAGGVTTFIGTLAASDVAGVPGLTTWTSHVVAPQSSSNPQFGPGSDPSRSTPNGEFFVFESAAELTSDPNGGHTEIYWYNVSTGQLRCISCNQLGLPVEDARLEDVNFLKASIPIHNLSEDGNTVLFETREALVSQDVDSSNDIYEWSRNSQGDASLHLISAGDSAQYFLPEFFGGGALEDDLLFGVTPNGSDVLFSSRTPLLQSAGGSGVPALYDARVNGGFREPISTKCLEACQATGQVPVLPGSASSNLRGTGNVKKRHCTHRNARASKRGKCRRRHKAHATHRRHKSQGVGR